MVIKQEMALSPPTVKPSGVAVVKGDASTVTSPLTASVHSPEQNDFLKYLSSLGITSIEDAKKALESSSKDTKSDDPVPATAAAAAATSVRDEVTAEVPGAVAAGITQAPTVVEASTIVAPESKKATMKKRKIQAMGDDKSNKSRKKSASPKGTSRKHG